jgi:hypothetical protein
MRKVAGLICILALTFGAVASFAAARKVITVTAPKGSNTTGHYAYVTVGPDYGTKLAPYKAQNHLSAAMNQGLKSSAMKAPAFHNGTIDTVPYFQNWFITSSRNSVYPYSMVGQNPKAGGTTGVNNRILPLAITLDDFFGNHLFTFDPTVANDPEGSDVALLKQSPLYDATTTYPGPPADTGQIIDTAQRVTFRTVRAANWHTVLNPAEEDFSYHVFLDPSSWAYLTHSHGNVVGEVVDINTLSTIFGMILNIENSMVPLPNSTVAIFVTDYLTAYIPPPPPSPANCCVLGYHTAQTGIANPNGILTWTWATYIPHSANNPFGAFGFDSMVLSHELSELFNDPFVNTNVAPWVDGSVSFAQGNLETGDTIEAMKRTDVIYTVPLNTTGGPYTYNLQNVATLEWFTRNPFNGGIYSWPNEGTLSHNPHIPAPGTCSGTPTWAYGQGSAGFFFCNSNTGW